MNRNENFKQYEPEKQPGWQLTAALSDIDENLVEEARQPWRQSANGRNWYKGLAAVLALALMFSCSSLAWAMNSLQQEQQTRREFYLRYLTPDQLEHIDWSTQEGRQRVRETADVLFAALESDDMYKQYIAINQLVELYNNPELRARAAAAVRPFLDNEEPKLAEAAAFALDILEQRFESPLLYKMADGSIFFTLFNDYSDYGSYNELWRIKDGRLELFTGFCDPLMYITDIIPSPDGQLLAVSLCSNKSTFVVVIDFIKGRFSEELIASSRVFWGYELVKQGIYDRFPDMRFDHENYCGWGNLRWLDNETLGYDAALSYNHTDNVDTVRMTYNYRTDEYTAFAIDRDDFGED